MRDLDVVVVVAESVVTSPGDLWDVVIPLRASVPILVSTSQYYY